MQPELVSFLIAYKRADGHPHPDFYLLEPKIGWEFEEVGSYLPEFDTIGAYFRGPKYDKDCVYIVIKNFCEDLKTAGSILRYQIVTTAENE